MRVIDVQHTDVPLRAIGIAIYASSIYLEDVWVLLQLSLYDSSMNKIGMTYTHEFYGWWPFWYTDTNFCVLTLPGKIVRIQPLDSTDMALRFAYFDKPLDLSEGDYYIGLAHVRDSLSYYGLREIPMVQELHGPPYLFGNSAIRYYQNNMWIDDTLEHILPSLFLIIEPECRMVEEVRGTTDTSGCVNVEWDSLPWQDQWVLRLAGPTGTRYDTVDTCSHTYCGLDLSEHYEVSVQSRCYPPKDSRQVSTCCMPPHRTSTSRKNWW